VLAKSSTAFFQGDVETMSARTLAIALVACLFGSWSLAQSSDTHHAYEVPRTEQGDPDFQGVWSARISAPLERPEGLPLVLSPEQAAGIAQAVARFSEGNVDPDIDRFGPSVLAVVNGENRSSIIVYPEKGVLPYNALGAQRAAHAYFEGVGYDGPEQRPGVERCTEAWGSPPMGAFMYQLFHGFVQAADTIVIASEELASLRIIHMGEKSRPDAIRSFDGHSVGRWEGDTLVIETTHYSDTNPERATTGRPMLISSEAHVTERFTRTSETELNYQYSVDDPKYYTEPWRGEFSFIREESDRIYEYACHEGNYSMVGALRGQRAIDAQADQELPVH
jgi:hypothetical protein